MRGLARDERRMYISLYATKEKLYDQSGKWTGEWKVVRSAPFPIYASLSAVRGSAAVDIFGVDSQYDRTATMCHVGTGITDTAVLWVDRRPTFDEYGNLKMNDDGTMEVPFDYEVRRVAESSNNTVLALKRVEVA